MAIEFSDDFNRADGALGANWSVVAGAASIVSNQLKASVVTANVVTVQSISTANGFVAATFNISSTETTGNLCIRADATLQNMYAINFYYQYDTIDVYRRVAGSYVLVERKTGVVIDNNAENKVECETIDANTVQIRYYNKGTLQATVNDTASNRITSAGRGGMIISQTADTIDNFSMGTLGTSGGTTGQIKVWNGSSFVAKPVKVWNGSAWVTKPVKYWNGSAWVTTTY